MRTRIKKYLLHGFIVVSSIILAIGIPWYYIKRTKPLPSDISCSIVDLKFDGEKIKILEFGTIRRSRFKGYDVLYKKGGIWKNFWKILTAYNVPIWCVCDVVYAKKTKHYTSLKTLAKNPNTRIVKNVKELRKHPEFLKQAQEQTKGIIVITNYNCPPPIRRRLAKDYPSFVLVSKAIAPFVGHKQKSIAFFDTEELQAFRPKSNTYLKKYTPELTQNILSDFSDTHLVIKPVTSSKGNGIIILHRNDLDKTLKFILSPENKDELEQMDDISYSYWHRDKNDSFIIESFTQSKPIKVTGKMFDGTMRVVFVTTYDEGKEEKVELTFLGSYWKIPAVSLEEEGSLNDKHKSQVKGGALSSAKVSKNDYEKVKKELHKIVPKIYKKMVLAQKRK